MSSSFAPSTGPGLSINILPGTVYVNGVLLQSTTLIHVQVPQNSISYVYLDLTALTVTAAQSQSGFPLTNCYPIAVVTTGVFDVSSLVDSRPDLYFGAGGGGGGTGVLPGVNITTTPAGANTIVSAPGTKISQLTDVSPMQTTDLIPIVRSGKTQRISAGTIGMPQHGTYTFYVNNGVVYARDNASGNIVSSNTDAAIVINSVLSGLQGIGGVFFFKNGVYNFNSATQETTGGYSSYYCVGIPRGQGPSAQFTFIGEAETSTTFNITTAAEAMAGSNVLNGFWSRPSTDHSAGYYWGNFVYFENMQLIIPTFTRGNEVAFNMLEAAYASFINVIAYPSVFASSSSALPAAGTTAFISPATFSDGIYMRNTIAQLGWDVGFEINTEHSHLEDTAAYLCTIGYYFGRNLNQNNVVIGHANEWLHPEVYDCKTGIRTGVHFQAITLLDIIGLDLEYTHVGTFAYVNGFVEDTPGLTGGIITWSQVETNVARGNLSTLFAAGSGKYYILSSLGNVQLPTTGGINSASVALTTQAATIGATNLIASPVATTLYEVGYYLKTTTVGAAGTVTVTLTWNDGAAQTFTSATCDLSTTNSQINGQIVLKATSGAVQYATTVTSGAGSQYSLDLRVLPLG